MSEPKKPPAESKILIVDDNEQNVELLEAYLADTGYRVRTAYDGQQALDAVAKDPPDLILLDIMMPGMNGFEVCRRLKGEEKTRAIPIVMVTALNELQDIEKGVDAGTDDFLTKPIHKVELLARVKSLLRVGHLQSELDRTLAYLNELEQE